MKRQSLKFCLISTRSLCFRFWGFTRPRSPRLVVLPILCALYAFSFWGFTRPKSLLVGCLPNHRAFFACSFGVLPAPNPPVRCFPKPPRFVCLFVLGFYPPQTPPVCCPPNPLRFRFSGFTRPKLHPRLVAFPSPALSLLSSFLVLNPPK